MGRDSCRGQHRVGTAQVTSLAPPPGVYCIIYITFNCQYPCVDTCSRDLYSNCSCTWSFNVKRVNNALLVHCLQSVLSIHHKQCLKVFNHPRDTVGTVEYLRFLVIFSDGSSGIEIVSNVNCHQFYYQRIMSTIRGEGEGDRDFIY